MTGQKLLDEFKIRGFNYSKEQLFNLYISLKSKPFVIISGISGSGKSKIIELLAEIISGNNNDRFELVAVKPNWRDSRFVFGFHNLINGNYNSTPILNLLVRAKLDPKNPYFLILDEMNLAKVEQYFADFLSFLETRRYVQENGKVLFEDLKTNFKFPENTPLSEAIIMSCFHINPENLFRPIKDYREDIFSRLWKNQFYSGRESNWTAQFRTEINQKDVDGNPSRLAGKLLLGGDGEYRLQDNENLSESLINELFVIKSRYDNLISQLFTISQKKIKLHTQGVLKTYDEMPDFVEGESLIIDGSQKKYYIPSEIEIPLNLFVVGTVNMDETTHMFSPKVLDRANVIEMNEIDLHAITNNPDHIEKNVISDDNFYFLDEIPGLKINLPTIAHTREFSERYPEQFNDLFEINKSLKQINRHFGYRVYNEISNYILNAINLSIPENIVVSTDIQILQKILPKLHGSFQQLYNPLMKIFCLCYNEVPAILVGKESFDENDFRQSITLAESSEIDFSMYFKYPRTAKKLQHMISELIDTGFTSYIQ